MTNLLLTTILLALFANLAVFLFIYRALLLRFRAIFNSDNEKPSQFAQSVDLISHIFAQSMTREIKTTLMGMKSGQVRAEQAVMKGIAEDAIEQNPMASGLAEAFPGLGKRLTKNPALLQLVLGALSRIQGGGNGTHETTSQSPKFKF